MGGQFFRCLGREALAAKLGRLGGSRSAAEQALSAQIFVQIRPVYPYPPPAIFQPDRWSGVASSRRGYQAKGTMIVRPSTRSTANVSSVKCTSRTLAPGLGCETLMPFLQQQSSILCDEAMYTPQFCRTEAKVSSERDGFHPELCRLIVPVHMNVGWFVRLVAVEIHTVWPSHQDGRHAVQYLILTAPDCPWRMPSHPKNISTAACCRPRPDVACLH